MVFGITVFSGGLLACSVFAGAWGGCLRRVCGRRTCWRRRRSRRGSPASGCPGVWGGATIRGQRGRAPGSPPTSRCGRRAPRRVRVRVSRARVDLPKLVGRTVWMIETAGWIDPNTLLAPTYQEMTAVLSDLDALVITAEFLDGLENDISGLDNVILTPEPATLSLLGIGGLALLRSRRAGTQHKCFGAGRSPECGSLVREGCLRFGIWCLFRITDYEFPVSSLSPSRPKRVASGSEIILEVLLGCGVEGGQVCQFVGVSVGVAKQCPRGREYADVVA